MIVPASLRPFSLILSATTFLSACAMTAAAADCPHSSLPCAGKQRFATVSSDPAEIDILTEQTRMAADNYALRFGAYPAATVIVPGGTITPERQAALEDNGYVTVMPWITAQQRNRLRESAIRSQIEAQLAGQPEAIREAALAAALAQVSGASASPHNTSTRNKSVLAHELGHKWFINQFRVDEVAPSQHAYGGWAPDWLDEAVAVSMEGAELKARRRDFFERAPTEDRIPLPAFFTMEHPSAAVARTLLGETGSGQSTGDDGIAAKGIQSRSLPTVPDGARQTPTRKTSRVITLSGEAAERFVAASGGDHVLVFYAQALRFTDYLEARTGRPSILADIAAALRDGEDFKIWLADNPYDLPRTIAALQADWDRFLAA